MNHISLCSFIVYLTKNELLILKKSFNFSDWHIGISNIDFNDW